MNFIDRLLDKIGMQTLLTSKVMLKGSLEKEEAKLYRHLRGIHIPLDNEILGIGASLFNSSHARDVTFSSDSKLERVLKDLAKIENDYEISSLHHDFKRLDAINQVLLKAHEDGVKESALNSLTYIAYGMAPRFTIYPTRPVKINSTVPVFVTAVDSPIGAHATHHVDTRSIMDNPILYTLFNIFEEDKEGWVKANGKVEPDLPTLMSILYKFQYIGDITELITFAAEVFEPNSIKELAARCFTTSSLARLDKVRDVILEVLDGVKEAQGFIDYRLVLCSLFITQLRFSAEEK